MVQTICESMEATNVVGADVASERKSQLSEELLDDEHLNLNGNMRVKNYSNPDSNFTRSEALESSSNFSSHVVKVTATQQNLADNVESPNINSNDERDGISDVNESKKAHRVRKFRTIIDSDSEDDTFISSSVNNSEFVVTNNHMNGSTKKSKSFASRIDSDSDDVSPDKVNEENLDDNQSAKDEPITKTKSKGFSDLIDSESEDENDNRNIYSSTEDSVKHCRVENSSQRKNKKEKSVKKRAGTKRAAKDEAMRHIHSETQRLVREAPVSLPYHRPKQRSLQEFLNRKKVAPVIPQACTAAVKMRMCTAIVNEAVKAKEKEAKLFYESSDSEDDDIPEPAQSTDFRTNALSSVIPAHISIEETQKLHKIDIQNAQNKKQMIQQGILELGVPRKLFTNDFSDPMEVKSVDTPAIILHQDGNGNKQKKECKLGLKEVSVPRKLFDNKFDDTVGVSLKKYDSFTSDCIIQADGNSGVLQEDVQTMKPVDGSGVVELEDDGNNSDNGHISQTNVIASSKSNQNSENPQSSQDGVVVDSTATQSISISQPSSVQSEIFPISDTPIISNKEILKWNNKEGISEESLSLLNEIHMKNTSKPSEPNCAVRGLPLPVPKSSVNVRKKTLMNVPKSKPILRGSPGTLIDFTSDVKPNKAAVNNLVDRFISKHSVVNRNIESKSEVTVLRTETDPDGLKIYKDVLPYSIPATNESFDDPDLNKPGAKLMRLKVELEKKMASKRNEEWKHRMQESMIDEEEEDVGVKTKELEPEEKYERLAEDEEISDTEESEPEEDVLIRDKRRKPCAFGDEEAEVDDDDEMELSADERDDAEDSDGDEDEGNDCSEEEDENENNDVEENIQKKQKRYSRIVTDNDDSNSGGALDNAVSAKFERKRTDVDMFGDDDDELPVSPQILQPSQVTPVFKTPLTPKNPTNFLESQGSRFSSLSLESPRSEFSWRLSNSNKQTSDRHSQSDRVEMKNKLFETQDRNVTDEELMALCSGRFTDGESNTQNDNCRRLTGLIDSVSGEKPVTESQIIGLCSGTFSSQGLLSSTDLSENVDENSQHIRLTFDDSSQNSNDHILQKKSEEVKKSPKVQSSIQSFLDIASSSDDEIESRINNPNKTKVLKKKKVKQLILSDDEDEDEEEVEDIAEENEDEETFVDYDSEENEVVMVSKKDLKKVAANFVDAEAELSESEWGSEDEDEEGMEKMEMEDGDGEEIDEDQMRAQLGKLHARQLLDDDQRDVRILKEMLFEDGDLHTDGAGRERRFKWRNIDKLADESLSETINHDDDGHQLDPTELVNEVEWRKLRLEREKFLEEKMKSETDLDAFADDIDISSGSKFLRMGMKVLKKCKTSIEIKSSTIQTIKPIVPRTVSELMGAPNDKMQISHNAMKRGSFLARGDEALARLAVMIKKSDTVDLAPKHSKNFLFHHISPSVTAQDDEDDADDNDDSENKRENIQNRQKLAKKRKTASSGTPKTAKKPKIDTNRSSGKKLF